MHGLGQCQAASIQSARACAGIEQPPPGSRAVALIHVPHSGVGAGADPAGPPLERAALVFAHAAPHPGVLAALERPLQAGLDLWASAAYLLGLVDLAQRTPGVADR